MSVPYFPSLSWAERTAQRVPRQGDLLQSSLGKRFGMAPTGSAGAPAGAPAAPQATAATQPVPGATSMAAPPMAVANPFRPAAASAPPGFAAAPGGMASSVAGDPAPGISGNDPNVDRTGQNSVMGVGNAGEPMPDGSWIDWANANHPEVAQYFGYVNGDDSARRALERYASTLTVTPGSAAWWEALTAWTHTPEGQAVLQGHGGVNDTASNQPPAGAGGAAGGAEGGEEGTSGFNLDPELEELVRMGILNPSRYTRDFVGDMWKERAGDLDAGFNDVIRGEDARLRSQGIRDSTFAGEEMLERAGEHRTAKRRALQDLMEGTAANMSADRSRAIADALALRESQEGSREFGMNWEMANRFGMNDRAFRDRDFDWRREFDTERFNAEQQQWYDQMYQWMLQTGQI